MLVSQADSGSGQSGLVEAGGVADQDCRGGHGTWVPPRPVKVLEVMEDDSLADRLHPEYM